MASKAGEDTRREETSSGKSSGSSDHELLSESPGDLEPESLPDTARLVESEPLARLRRRVELKALVLGLCASIAWFLSAGAWPAFVLTVTWAVGIVCFRGLAVQVRNLSRTRSTGAHLGVIRFVTLAFALIFITRLGFASPTAFLIGLGVLPAALMLEVLHQLLESEV